MLEVQELSKTFPPTSGSGRVVQVFADLDFKVADGEFLSIVGPSGCGKTTLLMCLSGLLPSSSGQVRFQNKVVTEPPSEMAFVFQDYSRSLLPWHSVRANVMLPLRVRGERKDAATKRADEVLQVVGLAHAAERYPWQLSGGMQQRVAIARALAVSPQILMMDEPFASVDAQTRMELEDVLLRIWADFHPTIVFVTHDIDEAVYLSDRIMVLSASPARVESEHLVDLPRPRSQIETKSEPRYVSLRAEVVDNIMRPGDVSTSATSSAGQS